MRSDGESRGSVRGAASVALGVLLLAGCTSVGPETIPRDRFDYNRAIGESWKRQMLANIVKLRYGEPPVFMDVSSVINQYELRGTISAGVGVGTGLTAGDTYTLGGRGTFVDRPTITYSPLSGAQFTRSLLTPMTPFALLGLVQSGYPVDFIFGLAVKSINGVRAPANAGLFSQAGDPEFVEVLTAMRRLQLSGGVGMRLRRNEGGTETVFFFAPGREGSEEEDGRFCRRALGLDPSEKEFRLEFGAHAQDHHSIALLTRSMLEILIELSADIAVPAAHVSDGRSGSVTQNRPKIVDIHSGSSRPADTFAAMQYQDHWYWVDNTDMRSKRVLTFMMILFSLAETGEEQEKPVITVGAGGG